MSALPLDPLTLPLFERRLIEASAGTGKTYTISGLYLRLLLGDENTPALTCEQILVVTFTNAATEELRDRIRKRIKACYLRFIGLNIDDPFIDALFNNTPVEHHHLAIRRLSLALNSLDEASIFTIHGFCQRILSDMAFESALLFDAEFTLDDSEYLHHSVCDFWRENCYNIEDFLAKTLINNKLNEPKDLQYQISALLGASQAKANISPSSFSNIKIKLNDALEKLQHAWENEKNQHLQLLHSLPLNGTTFGKKADKYPKLAEMFDDMDNWSKHYQEGNKALPPAKVCEKLSLNNIKLNKGGVLPTPQQAPLLAQIENFVENTTGIIASFLFEARQQINDRFNQLKQDANILSPDDLLITLANALTAEATNLQDSQSQNLSFKISQKLKASIRTRFPVALIDEFQDTDPLQFSIFSSIYPETQENTEPSKTNHAFLMIGDPKQAIYAFRGADIFTYINARKNTPHHYNLTTNYRSSQFMVESVNALFNKRKNPFKSSEIPFDLVASADKGNKCIKQTNTGDESLFIRLLAEDDENGLNKTDAREYLANDAANQIAQLLNDAQNHACQILSKGDSTGKALKAKDIAVLVRDRNEAAYIRNALNERGIGAVFLSRDSVMHTFDAKEMVLILRALANPKDENAIRAALACQLIGYNAKQIHSFNQSEDERAQVLAQFYKIHQIWQTRGIMPALLNLANEQKLLQRLTSETQSERRLTDFRHLAELLQKKSAELDGISALLNWYEQEIKLGRNSEEQQLRLESEQNLVQIVTIHKSKGLEYPVCFIPFISLARDTKNTRPATVLYHKNDQLIWDLKPTEEGLEKLRDENLAEDLRLLYVALTRPIYRCYLSIANHSRINKSGIVSFLNKTAIGYLLEIDNIDCSFLQLKNLCDALKSDAIAVSEIDINADEINLLTQKSSSSKDILAAQIPAPKTALPWRVGSYSGLVKHLPHEKLEPGAEDENFDIENQAFDEEESNIELNRFTFEKGANAGSFMHLVMELIDFDNAKDDLLTQLPIAMQQYNFNEEIWLDVLYNWYLDILDAPLKNHQSDKVLTLSKLTSRNKLVEMEFYLPLNKIQDKALGQLLNLYGYNGNLEFDQFKGMLKGFIDLTFEFDGKFYIADYKSNHLGEQFDNYNDIQMAQAISQHRYDLQYLIYTLALHRYLTLRLDNYDYEQHFGGCYYLFLRGMSAQHENTGVFYDKPPKELILALDTLFRQDISATNQDLESAQ